MEIFFFTMGIFSLPGLQVETVIFCSSIKSSSVLLLQENELSQMTSSARGWFPQCSLFTLVGHRFAVKD
jgi:hypothetical protein